MSKVTMVENVTVDELKAALVDDLIEAFRPHFGQSGKRPMSRDDMAEWLGIGVATLDRMTRKGEIPSVMLSRRRLYIPDQVIAAISNNEKRGTE